MTTFGIDIGHNCPPDTGAVGVRREDELTFSVGEAVIARLSAMGHHCIRTRPTYASTVEQSLRLRCSIANINNVDTFVSIHFNASRSHQGKGSEIYYISSKGKKIAQPVQKELVKLGFRNRGVKHGRFYVLRNTNAPAILVEVAFCDNAGDMDIFKKVGMNGVANAIVAGLTT